MWMVPLIIALFAWGISREINRDTYTGNGKLERYPWEGK